MRQGLTVPTLYPSRCKSCGSSYLESSQRAGAILSPHLPDTKPGDWHTASPTGGSLCGNCSYSATCFPRPQPPPVPAHPAHSGWRRGGGGRVGSAGALRPTWHLDSAHPGSPSREGPILPACPLWGSLDLGCRVQTAVWGAYTALEGERLGSSSPKASAILLRWPGPRNTIKGNRNKQGTVQVCRT